MSIKQSCEKRQVQTVRLKKKGGLLQIRSDFTDTDTDTDAAFCVLSDNKMT